MLAFLISAVCAATPVIVDPNTGAPKLERGILSAPLRGELSSAARTWVAGRRKELMLPDDSVLVNGQSFGTRWGASFHLQQQIDGIEVYGADAVVTIDSQARVVAFASGLFVYQQAQKNWNISQQSAIAKATQHVFMPELTSSGQPKGRAKKVYFSVGTQARAGWLVHVPTVDYTQNIYIAIDADSGEMLQRWNRVFRASLKANVYSKNPGGIDGGVGRVATIQPNLTHDDGGSMLDPDAGSVLIGTHLDAYNCCVYKNCDPNVPDAGPKRRAGKTSIPGIPIMVPYDSVVCDFQHYATNDDAKNDAGSFEYTPVDPPLPGAFQLSDPANSDAFSEVNVFFHANRYYDWVRSLSVAAAPLFPGHDPAIKPFMMREEQSIPPKKTALWTNVVLPRIQDATSTPTCVLSTCYINNFQRVPNAAFITHENFTVFPIPDYQSPVDTLVSFQGDRADYSYDGTVIWHEMGHGVVYATANLSFDRVVFDRRGANNEGGAMHEGFADFLAAAYSGDTQFGTYVSPRLEADGGAPFIRTLDNDLACPDALHGEVHDDSQPVSAALWKARKDLFAGGNDGKTFDAVVYATLVGMPATADFTQMAAIMEQHVNTVFLDGGTGLHDVFKNRGVVECSKVVDITNNPVRPLYGIGGRSQAGLNSGVLPGPVQLKLKVPNGTASVSLTANYAADPTQPGAAPSLRLLGRVGSPMTFVSAGGGLQNDSQRTADVAINNGNAQATLTLDAPCGDMSEIFLTIGNASNQPAMLENLKVTFQPRQTCTDVIDAGQPDAGTGVDAGAPTSLRGIPKGVLEGPTAKGCGCTEAGGPLGLMLALSLLLRKRRDTPARTN